ncbi:MAG: hypothetical protein JTT11_10270 [Candidatus Brockarchaeota archaeon]|nr:hypothetical protein [Candidatus Brockarchaeota archaeon]
MKLKLVKAVPILICAFASAIPAALCEPAGNQTQALTADWFENFIEGVVSGAAEGAARFGAMALRAVVRVISSIYGLLAVAGAVLWASGIDRQLGKRLVLGSAVLLVVAEFAAPLAGA